MYARAAGRAIAEPVVHRRYQTIDLGRLGYERVEAGEPYVEEGIL
jgi:FAD-dependent oxidoreductase domain-containing protein 1